MSLEYSFWVIGMLLIMICGLLTENTEMIGFVNSLCSIKSQNRVNISDVHLGGER